MVLDGVGSIHLGIGGGLRESHQHFQSSRQREGSGEDPSGIAARTRQCPDRKKHHAVAGDQDEMGEGDAGHIAQDGEGRQTACDGREALQQAGAGRGE